MTNESAQLNVLISGGFAGAYEQLLPEFQRMSGMKVTTGSGASQGSGPQTIAAQLDRGVAADVVILSREGLNELIATNRIATGTDVNLASVPLGVAVHAGCPKPEISTVDSFKQVLLKARAIAIPGSTGGIWLTTDVFPRLGIAEKINVKLTPRGTGATAMVAAGEADIGSAKSCTRQASTSSALFRRRFSSPRCFQPPSWRTRARLKLPNDSSNSSPPRAHPRQSGRVGWSRRSPRSRHVFQPRTPLSPA
jgi:hypothetical protein